MEVGPLTLPGHELPSTEQGTTLTSSLEQGSAPTALEADEDPLDDATIPEDEEVQTEKKTHGKKRNTKKSDDDGLPKWEGSYTGDLQDGVRQGKGTVVYPNGDRYTGDFRAGECSSFVAERLQINRAS